MSLCWLESEYYHVQFFFYIGPSHHRKNEPTIYRVSCALFIHKPTVTIESSVTRSLAVVSLLDVHMASLTFKNISPQYKIYLLKISTQMQVNGFIAEGFLQSYNN